MTFSLTKIIYIKEKYYKILVTTLYKKIQNEINLTVKKLFQHE